MNHINSFTVSLQEALLFSWMSLSMALLTNNNPVRAVAHVRGFWGKPPGKFFYFFFWPQPGVRSPETEMWHRCFSFSAVSEMRSWCLTQRSLLWPHSHGSKNCLMTPSNFQPQKGKRVYCEHLVNGCKAVPGVALKTSLWLLAGCRSHQLVCKCSQLLSFHSFLCSNKA